MSMVLLDIDPDEPRDGPSMIPFTSDLDACDEMDGDSVAGGCGGRRTSSQGSRGMGSIGSSCRSSPNNSQSGASMDDDGSSRSGSGGSVVVEKKRDENKKKHHQQQQHRPSSSHDDDDGTNSSSNEESLSSSSTSSSSPRRRRRRSASGAATRRLSSSLNESSSLLPQQQQKHHHQYENNLECQAYTTTHLEALRLRREAGKVDRRAYSFNDSMTNLGDGNDNNGTRQWKPTLGVLDGNSITEPSSAVSVESSGTFVDVRGSTPREGGHIDDDDDELKKQKELDIIMPDLSIHDNKINPKALPAQTKTAAASTSLVSAEKVIAHSTSCASNMSSDTTKTIKSGNVNNIDVTSAAASNKLLQQSQSGSSMSARDNYTANVSKEATAILLAASATPRKRNSSISKGGKSSSTTAKQSSSSNKGKSPDDNKKKQAQQPPQLDDNNTNNTKMNQTMREYVINDLLNIDSRNQDGSATEDIDANMEEFLRIPSKLENLMIFSLAVCIDSFLYAWAMLPLKFVWGIVCIICSMIRPRGVWGVRFHRR